jgi:hypothetical protein
MITVRHINKTPLQKDAYIKTIEKFANLRYDMIISFDRRISDFGLYHWDSKKNIHKIQINPDKCKSKGKDTEAEKYELIGTTLHELCHANQLEYLGSKIFHSDQFSKTHKISNEDVSEWYSEAEIKARIFEDQNIIQAVLFYDSCCIPL